MRTQFTSNMMWFDKPATDFNSAIPIGNGFVGGMVYSDVENDKISLNEATIWTGSPYNNNKECGFSKLSDLRAKTLNNEPTDKEWDSALISGRDGQIYQLAGDLLIDYSAQGGYTNYKRWLDFENGLAKLSYITDGKEYTREYFASYPANCIASKISTDSGSITFTATFSSKMAGKSSTSYGDTLIFTGEGGSAKGIDGGIVFCVATKFIQQGGSINYTDDSITVSDANSVTMITCITTNFVEYNDISGDEKKAIEMTQNIAKKNYDDLKNEHISDFKPLYNRVNFKLSSSCNDELSKPTSQKFSEFTATDDPSFVELVYNYDRYLVISSSREGGQPSNLQALWNDTLTPPWDSKYTVNINTQMNYWGVYPCNIPEIEKPLVEKLKKLQITGHETARILYGITRPGAWVLHHNTDLWNINGPIDGVWGLTPTCGAWFSNQLYDNYEFTLDRDYLLKIYPIIKGSAEFFADFLIPYSYNEKVYLVPCPSTSPEHRNGPLGFVTYGSSFDNQIIRELFQNVSACAKILGIDSELSDELELKCSMLPEAVNIGSWGEVKEYFFHEYDFPDDTHRHISHLYGIFPGKTIDKNTNPYWCDAVAISLEKRTAPGD